jgi:hypothetical protein
MRAIWAYTGLYGRWTYTKIMIVPPFTNMYEKIASVVTFNAPRIFPGEKHRSQSAQHTGRKTVFSRGSQRPLIPVAQPGPIMRD